MSLVNSALFYTKRTAGSVVGYGPLYDISYPMVTRDIDGPSGFVEMFRDQPYGVVIVEGSDADIERVVGEVRRYCDSAASKPVVSIVENGDVGLVDRLSSTFSAGGIRIVRATRIGDTVDVGLRN